MREGYSKGITLTPTVFGELDVVPIVVDTAGTRNASLSAPDTTVAAAGSGVYNITFPKAVRGWVLRSSQIKGASENGNVTAFDPSAGTCSVTLSGGANLTGSEQLELILLLSRKDASVAG